MGVLHASMLGDYVAPPFSPASVAGLAAWYDASQLTGLADGDPIATSPDRSGNARDLTQATAAKRPTFKTGILNGNPVMRFDGVDDRLVSPAFTLAQPNTVFVVASTTNAGTGQRFIADGVNGSGRNAVYVTAQKWAVYAGSTGTVSSQALSTGVHLIDYVFDNTARSLFVDSVGGTAGNAGGASLIGGVVLGDEGPTGGFNWPGDIAEYLFYNAAVSAANILLVRAYLKAKWGTP